MPGVVLNADVLAIIANFLDAAELISLSLVSRDLRAISYPCLYRHVYVETLPDLLCVANTIRRTPGLAAHVRSITEAVSRWRPFYVGVSPSQWPEYMEALLELLESVRFLTRLGLSVPADFCGDSSAQAFHPRLLSALSGLSHLTGLAISNVDFTALDLLDACGPLAVLHLSPSHTPWTGTMHVPERMQWITKMFGALERRHARTLVDLNIPYASVISKPQFAHMRLENVTTLIIPEGVTVYPEVAAAFPNLRHVRLGVGPHYVAHIDKVWPHLEHIELESCEAGLLSPGHCIRSLALRVERDEFLKYVPQLASPHVQSLKIRWEYAPPNMREIVAQFPGLKYVDLPMTLERLALDPEKYVDCPSWDCEIEVYDFMIQVMPPPAVDWLPDPPLDFLTRNANKELQEIVVNWVDANFKPRTLVYTRHPQSGVFGLGSTVEAVKIASKYRYRSEWPRWSACTL